MTNDILPNIFPSVPPAIQVMVRPLLFPTVPDPDHTVVRMDRSTHRLTRVLGRKPDPKVNMIYIPSGNIVLVRDHQTAQLLKRELQQKGLDGPGIYWQGEPAKV